MSAHDMEFRIAATFTAALARLGATEQKAAKTTAFDLQMDPAAPGLKFHRIDRSRDPHFWSVRVSGDLRIIIHKTEASFLLAYVGHHDDAYAWAERRRIEAHPRTGAIQIVEVRERVEEIAAPPPPAEPAPPAQIFRASVGRGPVGASACPQTGSRTSAARDRGRVPRSVRPPARRGLGSAAGIRRHRPPAPPCAGRRAGRPVRSPGRAAPFPGRGEPGGAGPGAGCAVGTMGDVSASGAAGHRGAELQRPGAHLGLGRHRQDGRGAASRRAPRPAGAGW